LLEKGAIIKNGPDQGDGNHRTVEMVHGEEKKRKRGWRANTRGSGKLSQEQVLFFRTVGNDQNKTGVGETKVAWRHRRGTVGVASGEKLRTHH